MKIRIVALVSMLAIGASVATAQAPAKDKNKGSEVKGDKKWGKHDAKKGERDDDRDRDDDRNRAGNRGWGSERRLLGGIQLTDEQKASIKAIHARYEPQQKAIRDTVKMNHKADMKPSASDPLRTRAQMLATQERGEIRTVLTAEQKVRFDQNIAKFEARRDGRGKRGNR